MNVTQVDVSQIISMIEEQVPNLHVTLQLLPSTILVILVLVASPVECRLYFIL